LVLFPNASVIVYSLRLLAEVSEKIFSHWNAKTYLPLPGVAPQQ